MSMPEQRHFLFQRTPGCQHAVGPPVRDTLALQLGGAQPVQITIGDLLNAAVTVRLDLHTQGLAGVARLLGRCGARGRERLKPGIEGA